MIFKQKLRNQQAVSDKFLRVVQSTGPARRRKSISSMFGFGDQHHSYTKLALGELRVIPGQWNENIVVFQVDWMCPVMTSTTWSRQRARPPQTQPCRWPSTLPLWPSWCWWWIVSVPLRPDRVPLLQPAPQSRDHRPRYPAVIVFTTFSHSIIYNPSSCVLEKY